MASAGPYANHLHLAADRQPRQYLTTQFLPAGCPSCHPPNSVKVLKAVVLLTYYKMHTDRIYDLSHSQHKYGFYMDADTDERLQTLSLLDLVKSISLYDKL